MKRTPLFSVHQSLGGKLIEFGGWEMPVQYSSITDEHLNVRKAAGMFDISHMGEFAISGKAAEKFLNSVLTNDLRKLTPGLSQYTLMCNDRGGVVDDLYVYRRGNEDYLLIVNASRIEDDFAWLEQQLAKFNESSDVTLRNVSDSTAAVAIQGPRVAAFIDACFPGPFIGGTAVQRLTELKKNQVTNTNFEGAEIWIARTGYTGEDGFEIVAPANRIVAIWNRLMNEGVAHGLKPAGLGARDTLRTEVCYPLYGHELDETTTPIEAGLGLFVALDKGEFAGRNALVEQKAQGAKKKLVAFKMTDRSAPPRPTYAIWSQGEGNGHQKIGEVASGTQSPSLGYGIGLAYVVPEYAKPETPIEVEIRGKFCRAMVVPKPIYRKPS